MLRDLGVDLGNTIPTQEGRREKPVIEVKVDASAGRGVAMRRGAGRIRHIATPTLWLQRYVSENIIAVTKQRGEDNVADLGTKHLDISTMTKHMLKCGFKFSTGQSAMALKAELQSVEEDNAKDTEEDRRLRAGYGSTEWDQLD